MWLFKKPVKTERHQHGLIMQPPTNGWLVQIKTLEAQGERVRSWVVAHPNWSKAQEIASAAQGLGKDEQRPEIRCLTVKVRREAIAAELEGLAPGAARQLE